MNFAELVAAVACTTNLPPETVRRVSRSLLINFANLIKEQSDFHSPMLVLRGSTGRLVVPPTVAPKAPPLELVVEGGRHFRPTYPHLPALDRPAMFVLGMKKCGSSLFNTIVQQLCAANGLGYLSLPDQAFEQNFHFVQLGTSPSFSSLFRDGWVYGGFRQLPDFLSSLEFFKARRKLLLVRDPRDALVSEYFSVAYSHSLPPADNASDGGVREGLLRRREEARAQTVDDFVLQASRSYVKQLKPLLCLKDDPLLALYRYEDVVLNKRPWIQDLADRLGLDLEPSTLEAILEVVDVLPTAERPTEFVRRVVPGDHREKLSAESIKVLDNIFADFLTAFGYH